MRFAIASGIVPINPRSRRLSTEQVAGSEMHLCQVVVSSIVRAAAATRTYEGEGKEEGEEGEEGSGLGGMLLEGFSKQRYGHIIKLELLELTCVRIGLQCRERSSRKVGIHRVTVLPHMERVRAA